MLACVAGKAFLITMTIQEKYQKERERIERNRALDWSSFSIEVTVLGERLVPMTVQTWFDLLAVKSPIIYDNEPTVESVIDYIWRNSRRYTKNKWLREWRLFWIQWRVCRAVKKLDDVEDMVTTINEHFKLSVDEFPTDSSVATARKINAMSPTTGEASMVDEIASRYSMNPADVLKMPLRQAFALQRVIRLSTIPDYKILEPDSLREIKSEYIRSLNNGKK